MIVQENSNARTLTLILALTCLFGCLTACSGSNNHGSVEVSGSVDQEVPESTEPTNNSAQINLNKYISVNFEGYNLAGYGSVKFDIENFLLEHINDVTFNQENFAVYKELYGKTDESAAKSILKYVSVSIENDNKLSNGDTVKIVWNIDTDKVNNYFKWDYTCSAQTFTVTGLEDAGAFDPFEDIEVVFSGTAPYGKAEIYGETKYGTYQMSPNENLKNGDIIKVTFSCEDKSSMILWYGKYPSSFEKTYVVSGLNTYVQSFTELSNVQQNKLISEARDKMRVVGYGNYKDAKYCGNYFYYAKDKPAHGVQFLSWCGFPVGNAICFVFEHPEDVYTVITLENLLMNENSELIYNKHDMEQAFSQYRSKEELEKAYVGVFDDIMYCSNNINSK